MAKEQKKVKQFPKPVKGEKKPVLLASALDIASIRSALIAVSLRLKDLEGKIDAGLKVTRKQAVAATRSVSTVSKRVAAMETASEKAAEREQKKAERMLGRNAARYAKAIEQVNAFRKLKGLPPLDSEGKEVKRVA
jgi:uncharacterized protein YkwD